MARKEDCSKCNHYKAEICTKIWKEPTFNDISCEYLNSTEKQSDNHRSVPDETLELLAKRIRKRGSSVKGNDAKKVVGDIAYHTNESKSKVTTGRPFYIGDKTYRALTLFWYFVCACVVIAIGCGGWYGWKYYKQAKKEDLALEICAALQPLRDNQMISYLCLQDMGLDGNDFFCKLTTKTDYASNPLFERLVTQRDKTDDESTHMRHTLFLSMMTLFPNNWDYTCHLLDSAAMDLKIIYSQVGDTCLIPHSRLKTMMSNSQEFHDGEDLFIDYKKTDIMNYARRHFRNDRYFNIDSVSLNSNFVVLHFNYDDNGRLGKPYLDSSYINPHFTDPVSDMGSISDLMLTICSLKNCGMAVEYVGRKTHQVHRWEWDASRTQAFLKDYPGYIPYSERKKNQIVTAIQVNRNK